MNGKKFSKLYINRMNNFGEVIAEAGARPVNLVEKFNELESIPVEKVLQYATQWFLITKTFGLSSASYLGVLASEIKVSDDESARTLEQILQKATFISSDDIGLFRGSETENKIGTIHYRLFQEMCSKLGDVTTGDVLPETKDVCDTMENLFATVSGGLAVYRVVEGIAYTIVEHQKPLFLAADNETKKLFEDKDLTYINLHLGIEGEHAKESEELIELYLESGGDEEEVLEQVEDLVRKFGFFWKKIDECT